MRYLMVSLLCCFSLYGANWDNKMIQLQNEIKLEIGEQPTLALTKAVEIYAHCTAKRVIASMNLWGCSSAKNQPIIASLKMCIVNTPVRLNQLKTVMNICTLLAAK